MDDKLSDAQAELADAIRAARELLAHLECAESCETIEDYKTNIDNALGAIKPLRAAIKDAEVSP